MFTSLTSLISDQFNVSHMVDFNALPCSAWRWERFYLCEDMQEKTIS